MTTAPSVPSKLPQIEKVLRKYFNDRDDEAAVQTVLSVYNAIENAQANMSGVASREIGDSALRLLVDISLAWVSNPFMQKHGSTFMHVVGLTINAMMDGTHLYAQARDAHEGKDADRARDLTIQANACTGLVVEIVVSALGLQKGWALARDKSLALRQDMWRAQKGD